MSIGRAHFLTKDDNKAPCDKCNVNHCWAEHFYFDDKGCEYCDGDIKRINCDNFNFSAIIKDTTIEGVYIKYCPMCGRKLQ